MLSYRGDEFVSVCHQTPAGDFRSAVRSADRAPGYVDSLGDGVNTWFSVNPTTGPERDGGSRGAAEHVTRLAALYADLDVKPGACADLATAEQIVDELSSVLGQRPSAVVFTGHGLQPYWPIDDGDVGDAFTVHQAASLSRRFGRLVALVAEHRHAKVDNVSDLPRILRAPDTVNVKSTPVRTVGRRDVGGPLTVAEVDERLDEAGICDQPEDVGGTVELSDPTGWTGGLQTCSYVASIVGGLLTDGPPMGGGRNPWAAKQSVRLHCALRQGCITVDEFEGAMARVEARLVTLLATTDEHRALRRYEMRDLRALGRSRAASKTDDQVRADVGDHLHGVGTLENPWGTLPGSPGSPTAVPSSPAQSAVDAGLVEATATTWESMDLGPYLRGEIELPKPSIGIVRSDGLRLLYAGREHAIIGETESGKTWFALLCVAIELVAGNCVVYVHFEEGDPSSTIERLRLLGVSDAVMAKYLRFVAPARAMANTTWMGDLLTPAPTLVVFDGINEGMALHGLEIAGSGGAEGWSKFRQWFISPATRVGAAVLSADHVTKNRDGAGRDAYGSVHKGNALNGARFSMENVTPFGRGMRGASHVFVTKDRPGFLRRHGRPSKQTGKTFIGTLVADDEDSFTPFELVLYAPKDDDSSPTGVSIDASSKLHEAMLDVIAAKPDRTVASARKLYAAMRAAGHAASDTAYKSTVDDLVATGRVEEIPGERGSTRYRAVATASQVKTS